ncbi:hypothetical protein BSKO_01960 [Bryopsis sp. KO-2023]|nr:hypothetical protein BSKO_01960 [Bryopsis sp. KO-2023]
MEGETPQPTTSRRRSSFLTPILDSFKQDENLARRSGRRPTDEIHKLLSPELTPTRRLSTRSNNPVFDEEEIARLQKKCLEMSRNNKFTTENVWGLEFIDAFADMVGAHNSGSRGFEDNSAGLDAAVHIYEKRVDATLAQALEAVHKISKPSRRRSEEGGLDDVGMDEEEEHVLPSQFARRRQRRNTQTLAKPADILLSDEAVRHVTEGVTDKIHSQLDQGGCNGRMALLGVSGLKWRSNPKQSKEGPMLLNTLPYVTNISDFRDLASFSSIQNTGTGEALIDMLGLSQRASEKQQDEPRKYMELAEDCLNRQEGYQSFLEEPLEAQQPVNSPIQPPEMEVDECDPGGGIGEDDVDGIEGGDDFSFNLPGDANIDVNFFDMDNDAVENGNQVPAVDMDGNEDEGPSTHMGGNEIAKQDRSDDEEDDIGPLPQDLQKLLASSKGKEKHGKARWAHWKYHDSTVKQKSQKKKPPRKKPELDWENLPKVPETTFQLPSNPSEINLKKPRKNMDFSRMNLKARNKALHLQPDNFRITASFLGESFLNSQVPITKNEKKMHQMNDEDGNPCQLPTDGAEPMDDDWSFDDGGGCPDLSFDNLEGGAQPDGGATEYDEDGFLKEPEKIPDFAVELPKFEQQVDIKALKMNLVRILKELSQSRRSSVIRFSEVFSRLMEIGGQGTVSIQLCFTALLFVASEHQLQMQNSDDLQELHITLPSG